MRTFILMWFLLFLVSCGPDYSHCRIKEAERLCESNAGINHMYYSLHDGYVAVCHNTARFTAVKGCRDE